MSKQTIDSLRVTAWQLVSEARDAVRQAKQLSNLADPDIEKIWGFVYDAESTLNQALEILE